MTCRRMTRVGLRLAVIRWKKLSTTPGYTNAEILTNITSLFLRPTGFP